MTQKIYLTNSDILKLTQPLATFIERNHYVKGYAIPRGGIPAAYALRSTIGFTLVDDPEEAEFFIDDIIDTGRTCREWSDKYPGKPFLALIDRSDSECRYPDGWVVFPWEDRGDGAGKDEDFAHTITRLLSHVGENPNRGGLLETPKRVAKAWSFWTKGYEQDPADVLKVFEDGAESCDEMVIVKDIPFYSHCEHHMAPIFGTASIAYIPDGKIVGLSKLSRLLDVFARRLQVQERLTNQVADALVSHLDAKGAGVVIKARHMCMESRGVCQQGHYTITSALRGVMKDQPETRAEFMSLVK